MQPQEYAGIDLHRHRSVIVRRSAEGKTLEVSHVHNGDLLAFERAVTGAGEHPEVVVEACYGWYWATTCSKSSAARFTWLIRSATTGATAE